MPYRILENYFRWIILKDTGEQSPVGLTDGETEVGVMAAEALKEKSMNLDFGFEFLCCCLTREGGLVSVESVWLFSVG
jgi:hypothetical protein